MFIYRSEFYEDIHSKLNLSAVEYRLYCQNKYKWNFKFFLQIWSGSTEWLSNFRVRWFSINASLVESSTITHIFNNYGKLMTRAGAWYEYTQNILWIIWDKYIEINSLSEEVLAKIYPKIDWFLFWVYSLYSVFTSYTFI